MPEQANDCGDGHWCSSGTQCWRAPANIGAIRQGELKCVNPSQEADLQRALNEQLKADRDKKLAEEEARRTRDERSRIDARSKEIERAAGAARKSLEQASVAQKQAAQQLQRAAEQRRQSDLQRLQKSNYEAVRSRKPETCAAKQIEAMATGSDPNKVQCGGNADASSPRPALPSAPAPRDKVWAEQLDNLKRNAVRLQPEERHFPPTNKVAAVPSTDNKCRTTFMCGTPPKQYACPCTIETPSLPATAKRIGSNAGGTGLSSSGGIEFQGGKLDSASVNIGKSQTFSLRDAQGQLFGVNTRLDAVQLQGAVSAGLGTKGAVIEVKGSGALLHGEATRGGTRATGDAGAAEVRASAGLGLQGVNAEAGAGAYLVRGRIDQSFTLAGFQVSGYAQAGIGVEAKAGFGVGPKDDKIQLGLGPLELGIEASRN
ncbi:hypothetical protein [Bradyrhizobium sp. Cp5.3]|uniref:hypothetical protein n=1 Tax=Bradyrhizobium sp. Cp5.3 TaxID=443598 RepID=UPI0004817075|nr:hypothetical protein [Bradyrhizobium sp. Cp5.3]